mmetsp:Transcript_83010/g.201352  ORF Transcript_83010/g.201352 Transcript_83010/m.201352 type:complete len:308 (-) Transcript_83010:310-1233(-)
MVRTKLVVSIPEHATPTHQVVSKETDQRAFANIRGAVNVWHVLWHRQLAPPHLRSRWQHLRVIAELVEIVPVDAAQHRPGHGVERPHRELARVDEAFARHRWWAAMPLQLDVGDCVAIRTHHGLEVLTERLNVKDNVAGFGVQILRQPMAIGEIRHGPGPSELCAGCQPKRIGWHMGEAVLYGNDRRVDFPKDVLQPGVEVLRVACPAQENVFANGPTVGVANVAERREPGVRILAMLSEHGRRDMPCRARLPGSFASKGAHPAWHLRTMLPPLQPVAPTGDFHGRASGFGYVDKLQLRYVCFRPLL